MRMLKRISLAIGALALTITFAKAQTALEGIRAIEVEQYENAKKIFSTLISANPSDANNYYYMGRAFYGQEKIDSAKKLRRHYFKELFAIIQANKGSGFTHLYRSTHFFFLHHTCRIHATHFYSFGKIYTHMFH